MKKGFTLVELLAVIVILAVIALITVPIVLNLIEESKEDKIKISTELYLDAVDVAVSTELMDGDFNSSVCEITSTGDLKCDGKVIKVDTNGKTPTSGTIGFIDAKIKSYRNIYIDERYVSYSDEKMEITKELVSSPCAYSDEDGSNTLNLSDVVTCGTESFYVMENDSTNVTMLAMYNLNVGNNPYPNGKIGIQNENVFGVKNGYTTYGTVAFSNTCYWIDFTNLVYISKYGSQNDYYIYDNNSNLYKYVKDYEQYLKQEINIGSVSATIMSSKQALDLYSKNGNPSWLYNTTYWLGTAYPSDYDVSIGYYEYIWKVFSYGDIDGGNSNDMSYEGYYGVRPIVSVSIYEIG